MFRKLKSSYLSVPNLFGILILMFPLICRSQEVPYFVTYSHHLEEPGSLEVEVKSATGKPGPSGRFYGNSTEFEYGATAWWTSELYLDMTGRPGDGAAFGGYRIENRVRPLMREHWINPVIYVEFEALNGADRSVLEVVGHDGETDLRSLLAEARQEKLREAELKLILSSDVRGWNLSENVIFEKNLKHAPWEFGYAIAASRPLRLQASAHRCVRCLQNVTAGAEMYGGLGDQHSAGLRQTSHYVGPVAGWKIPGGPQLTAGVGFGLNDHSLPAILRVGVAYELGQVWPLRGSR